MSARYCYRVGRHKAQIHDGMSGETTWWDITMLTPSQVEELRSACKTGNPLPGHIDVALGRTALYFYGPHDRADIARGLTKEQLRKELPLLRENEVWATQHRLKTTIKVLDTDGTQSLLQFSNPRGLLSYVIVEGELVPGSRINQYQFESMHILSHPEKPRL